MAGRPKITGDFECPKCGRLGRFRTRKVRGRRNARYIEHPYFRHNDDGSEHYINNDTKLQWHKPSIEDKSDHVRSVLSHKFNRIFETVRAYSPGLTKDEKRQWLIANIRFMQDVILPYSHMVTLLKWKGLSNMAGVPLPSEIEYNFNNMAKWLKAGGFKEYTDIVIAAHPYYQQLRYLHRKYEAKRRREIIKARVKKWKESYNKPPATLQNPNLT